jgi:hypothetical protein
VSSSKNFNISAVYIHITVVHLKKTASNTQYELLAVYFNMGVLKSDVPYILESNPHLFYSFRGLKNQMRIRFAV